MALFSLGCGGLAFIIVGCCTAVGNIEFQKRSSANKFLSYLAIFATPRKRLGEYYYSQDAMYVVVEKFLIVVVFPLGMLLAIVAPKQTWPAVLWITGGLLAFAGVYLGSLMFGGSV